MSYQGRGLIALRLTALNGGLLGVGTLVYRPELDIFSRCWTTTPSK